MKAALLLAVTCASAAGVNLTGAEVRLITLDPGHFHASLVQKTSYPQVSPVVRVYAPAGPDLTAHLKRIADFNARAEHPTHWEEQVYSGADFLDRMVRERAGNVVVIAGNNTRKTDYINRAVGAGLNVLADKPMAATPRDFALLRKGFARAEAKHVLLFDIMTERFEITSLLQRELARVPEVFGHLESGTREHPAVILDSMHYFFKEVAGKPLIRPAWFFDVRQEGEAIPDVGTHLVDLVQLACFPGETLDWKHDVKVLGAERWPTMLTPADFKKSTGLEEFPGFLKDQVGADGNLAVFANGQVEYTLRGVQVRVIARWDFAPPEGGKDSLYSLLRGSRADLVIKQGPAQHYLPVLYVENHSGATTAAFEAALSAAVAKLSATYPGLAWKASGPAWEIVIPERYNVGHEAHFAQVTECFLRYLEQGRLPAWEVPNMLAKYYTTTEAYRLSHKH